MKIYLVRHGETVGNAKNFHQTPETPLTQTGINQAKAVAKRLKDRNIDFIYSSTHLRTQQTSQIISEEIGVPVELWKGLMELRRPKEVIGKSVRDPEVAQIDELITQKFTDRNYRFSDEEIFDDLVKRGREVLDHILTKHRNQTVLCVSHGTFIKVLVTCAIFGDLLTPELFATFRVKTWAANTGITILEYSKERGFRLLSWNDMSHL